MVDNIFSLRERKHIETRANLQNSAIQLVVKNGLEKTTVDSISKLANVSPRTFFNYFDNKEDAILGFSKLDKSYDFKLENIDISREVKSLAIDYILTLFNSILADRDLHKKVMKLVRKYPQLLERKASHVFKMHERVVNIIRQIVSLKYPDMNKELLESNAQMISGNCVGAVKIAMKELSTKKNLTADLIKKRALGIINDAEKVL